MFEILLGLNTVSFSLVSQLSFNLCVALRIPETVWSYSPAFVSWCNWRPVGKMVSVGINGNVYNDINFLRPASTPWFTKFKQARAKLGGFVCRAAEWGVKPWIEWDENNENSGSFLTASMFVSARFSQVVAAFFPPRQEKLNIPPARRQIVLQQQLFQRKLELIGIVIWRLFFKLKISLVT